MQVQVKTERNSPSTGLGGTVLVILLKTMQERCCEDIHALHARVVHVGRPYMCYVNLMYRSTVGHQGWKCNRPFDWMTPGDLQWISGMM